jgi:eukaryotic-like serine/threonine-protein kinase
VIGRVLDGRYRLDKVVGAGGMGAVYEATHTGTGRRVAVKLIQQMALGDTDVWSRFQREARASSTIDTRHIVEVIDSGRDPETGLPFMAMELLRGEDLGALIERRGALDPSLAVRLVAQACIGLAKAHRAFVVHRDIKPANLFLTEEDEGDEVIVKLLDFGIAKVRPATPFEGGDGLHLTQTGKLLGTPLYMSPEQAQGAKDIDARTDIWSIGAVLYETLTGRSPFCDADNLGKLILAICSKPPPRPSTLAPVPPELEAIVMRCLSIEREHRFATTDDLLEQLYQLEPEGAKVARAEVWEGAEARAPSAGPRPPSGANKSRPSAARIRPSGSEIDTQMAEEASVASTLFASSNTGSPAAAIAAPKPRRFALAAAIALFVGAAAGAIWYLQRPNVERPATSAAIPSASASAPEAADAHAVTAKIEVVPADVTVMISGSSVPVARGDRDVGTISLDCSMGQEIVVTLTKGDVTRKRIVTIRESGPEPARISLDDPEVATSATAAHTAEQLNPPQTSAKPIGPAVKTAAPGRTAAPVPTHAQTFE